MRVDDEPRRHRPLGGDCIDEQPAGHLVHVYRCEVATGGAGELLDALPRGEGNVPGDLVDDQGEELVVDIERDVQRRVTQGRQQRGGVAVPREVRRSLLREVHPAISR